MGQPILLGVVEVGNREAGIVLVGRGLVRAEVVAIPLAPLQQDHPAERCGSGLHGGHEILQHGEVRADLLRRCRARGIGGEENRVRGWKDRKCGAGRIRVREVDGDEPRIRSRRCLAPAEADDLPVAPALQMRD